MLFNTHSTSTKAGDQAEIKAIENFKIKKSINEKTNLMALKGYLGHTFSASGVLETLLGLQFFNQNKVCGLNNFKKTELD